MNRWMAVAGVGVTAFGVTLALYVGSRLSVEAMQVLMGAACGVAAVLPVCALMVWALLRRLPEKREPQPAPPQPASPPAMPPMGGMPGYPPVIVVAAPGGPASAGGLPGGQAWGNARQGWGASLPAPRRFNIIGEQDAEWADDSDDDE